MKFSAIVGLLGLAAFTSALPTSDGKGGSTKCQGTDVGISPSRAAAVRAAFASASLVPQAIETINPKVEVSVSYDGKQANLGNTFTIVETLSRPDISFTAEKDYDPATTKYLILFVDPDAPMPTQDGSPALLSFFLHQATWNASPKCINPANNGGGEDVTIPAYRPLTPLSIAQHRYVQLVYRQPPGFQRPDELSLITAAFDLNKYVKDNNLVNVGAQYFREGAANIISEDGLPLIS